VSACVLAHANGYGISVTISLRGAHPGLVWNEAIASQYTLQEAAFYGNLFQVDGSYEPEQPLYACIGRALIAWDDDPAREDTSLDYLQKRICGTGECGLANTGPCTAPIETESICSHDAGWDGYYGDCEGQNYDEPWNLPVFPEVITTYLVDEG
jgi:hypothetical protein